MRNVAHSGPGGATVIDADDLTAEQQVVVSEIVHT